MRKMIMAGCLSTMTLMGAATLPVSAARAAHHQQGFNEWIMAVSKEAAADPQYKRIPLDTDAQTKSFMALAEQLYARSISPDDFRKAVIAQYPGHDYEIGFIISRLP